MAYGPRLHFPTFGDLDGDGDIEIVQPDRAMYAWDCPAPYIPENIEWGMFRNDMWRTGCYGFKIHGIEEKAYIL